MSESLARYTGLRCSWGSLTRLIDGAVDEVGVVVADLVQENGVSVEINVERVQHSAPLGGDVVLVPQDQLATWKASGGDGVLQDALLLRAVLAEGGEDATSGVAAIRHVEFEATREVHDGHDRDPLAGSVALDADNHEIVGHAEARLGGEEVEGRLEVRQGQLRGVREPILRIVHRGKERLPRPFPAAVEDHVVVGIVHLEAGVAERGRQHALVVAIHRARRRNESAVLERRGRHDVHRVAIPADLKEEQRVAVVINLKVTEVVVPVAAVVLEPGDDLPGCHAAIRYDEIHDAFLVRMSGVEVSGFAVLSEATIGHVEHGVGFQVGHRHQGDPPAGTVRLHADDHDVSDVQDALGHALDSEEALPVGEPGIARAGVPVPGVVQLALEVLASSDANSREHEVVVGGGDLKADVGDRRRRHAPRVRVDAALGIDPAAANESGAGDEAQAPVSAELVQEEGIAIVVDVEVRKLAFPAGGIIVRTPFDDHTPAASSIRHRELQHAFPLRPRASEVGLLHTVDEAAVGHVEGVARLEVHERDQGDPPPRIVRLHSGHHDVSSRDGASLRGIVDVEGLVEVFDFGRTAADIPVVDVDQGAAQRGGRSFTVTGEDEVVRARLPLEVEAVQRRRQHALGVGVDEVGRRDPAGVVVDGAGHERDTFLAARFVHEDRVATVGDQELAEHVARHAIRGVLLPHDDRPFGHAFVRRFELQDALVALRERVEGPVAATADVGAIGDVEGPASLEVR
eukprot:scaffold180_cov311-Pinguiococcus_pyrenoidosus.AAC.32